MNATNIYNMSTAANHGSNSCHSERPSSGYTNPDGFVFPGEEEESANAQTHFAGIILTLLLGGPLMTLALDRDWTYVLGTALFLMGMLMMYTSSTLYHAVSKVSVKKRLRILDHSSIFVMIAGSYSIICTSVLGGWKGWTLFAFLWACTIAGFIGKMIALGKHPRLSLMLYLMMGWVALLVIVPVYRALPHLAFGLIAAEGIFYTVGAYFFRNDGKHMYYHAIWHIFILLGSISHLLATMLILIR